MAQLSSSTSTRPASDDADNVLNFPQASERDSGATALELVYQAAEVFTGMEDRARDTEARARSLCESAIERLHLAEQRIEAVERSRRDIIHDAGEKLQDASRALKQAQLRIEAAERQAAASEYRAQTAEAQAHEARRVLAQVEGAIRCRLLGEGIDIPEPLHAVA
jgi:hypothetical protein